MFDSSHFATSLHFAAHQNFLPGCSCTFELTVQISLRFKVKCWCFAFINAKYCTILLLSSLIEVHTTNVYTFACTRTATKFSLMSTAFESQLIETMLNVALRTRYRPLGGLTHSFLYTLGSLADVMSLVSYRLIYVCSSIAPLWGIHEVKSLTVSTLRPSNVWKFVGFHTRETRGELKYYDEVNFNVRSTSSSVWTYLSRFVDLCVHFHVNFSFHFKVDRVKTNVDCCLLVGDSVCNKISFTFLFAISMILRWKKIGAHCWWDFYCLICLKTMKNIWNKQRRRLAIKVQNKPKFSSSRAVESETVSARRATWSTFWRWSFILVTHWHISSSCNGIALICFSLTS